MMLCTPSSSNHSSKDRKTAASQLCDLVRGARFRSGALLPSLVDGSFHEAGEALRMHVTRGLAALFDSLRNSGGQQQEELLLDLLARGDAASVLVAMERCDSTEDLEMIREKAPLISRLLMAAKSNRATLFASTSFRPASQRFSLTSLAADLARWKAAELQLVEAIARHQHLTTVALDGLKDLFSDLNVGLLRIAIGRSIDRCCGVETMASVSFDVDELELRLMSEIPASAMEEGGVVVPERQSAASRPSPPAANPLLSVAELGAIFINYCGLANADTFPAVGSVVQSLRATLRLPTFLQSSMAGGLIRLREAYFAFVVAFDVVNCHSATEVPRERHARLIISNRSWDDEMAKAHDACVTCTDLVVINEGFNWLNHADEASEGADFEDMLRRFLLLNNDEPMQISVSESCSVCVHRCHSARAGSKSIVKLRRELRRLFAETIISPAFIPTRGLHPVALLTLAAALRRDEGIRAFVTDSGQLSIRGTPMQRIKSLRRLEALISPIHEEFGAPLSDSRSSRRTSTPPPPQNESAEATPKLQRGGSFSDSPPPWTPLQSRRGSWERTSSPGVSVAAADRLASSYVSPTGKPTGIERAVELAMADQRWHTRLTSLARDWLASRFAPWGPHDALHAVPLQQHLPLLPAARKFVRGAARLGVLHLADIDTEDDGEFVASPFVAVDEAVQECAFAGVVARRPLAAEHFDSSACCYFPAHPMQVHSSLESSASQAAVVSFVFTSKHQGMKTCDCAGNKPRHEETGGYHVLRTSSSDHLFYIPLLVIIAAESLHDGVLAKFERVTQELHNTL